jgi:C4-dicarboxylate-specific signal transduction histidine kinase
MADSGVFRSNPLQGWQREAILKATQLIRERFGNPPAEPAAKATYDALLEVLDPTRRAVRLQREMSEAARKAALTERAERRARDRRAKDRRKVSSPPPAGVGERRKGDRRASDRRSRR